MLRLPIAPRSPRTADHRPTSDPRSAAASVEPEVILGPDGEPLADWEIELIRSGEVAVTELAVSPAASAPKAGSVQSQAGDGEGDDGEGEGDAESRNSRRRRRRRNKGRADGPQGGDQERFEPRPDRPDRAEDSGAPLNLEPVQVAGYLDLRDEGYGFLRVSGYLASRDDAYIPVKLTRQYGLRKGDYVTGLSRPAGRNEKNPAMLEIHSQRLDPDKGRRAVPGSKTSRRCSRREVASGERDDPNNMTARIIDLISPIGRVSAASSSRLRRPARRRS